VPVRDLAGRGQVVARSRIHVARLYAHDRRRVGTSVKRTRECLGVDRAIRIGGDRLHCVRPDPQQPKGTVDRGVALLTCDDAYRRRPDQAACLDVPSRARQDAMPCRGERDVVRGLATRDKPERCLLRQPERVLQPVAGDLLDHRCGGRHRRVEADLIPPGREDVGAGGRRQRAADHEAEVPRPGRRHERGLDGRGELLDHDVGVGALHRQRPAEGRPQLIRVGRRRDRPVAQRAAVFGDAFRRPTQLVSKVRHAVRRA
jgi:hypothetical protein